MASPKVIQPTKLDFMDALRAVVEGKRITRLEWDDPNIYVLLRSGFLSIFQKGKVSQLLVCDGDLLATDWIVIEDRSIIVN